MGIYTKKGDRGSTMVFDKKTGQLTGISKKSCRIKAIGAIDELNSYLGIVTSNCNEKEIIKKLRKVQENLFIINSILAGSNKRFPKTKIRELEKQIDIWEGNLPVLKNFIYYAGSKPAALVFYSRALSRRAERSLVALSRKKPLDPKLLMYMNRLSDYLFMMARYLNNLKGEKEVFWIGKKKR